MSRIPLPAKCLPVCLLLALGTSQLNAFSPPFCRDDSFPIDVRSSHLPVVGPSRLFPHLSIDDFPRTTNSVRVQVIGQSRDQLSYNAFHRSAGNMGRFAQVQATQTVDTRTGRTRFTLTRLDNACLAAADNAGVAPERLCAGLVADELMPGAYALAFSDPLANHQLQFTMTQSLRDAGQWNLVPSQRAGEPERLRLTTIVDTQHALHTQWTIIDATERDEYSGEVSADISLDDVRATGFDPFQMGLLTGLDLLDELSNAHRDWVLYFQQEDLFEQPPAAGDEDGFYGCEPVSPVCGAEYDTCVPTPDGWLGCNYDPGGHFGGGHGGDGGGGLPIGGGDDDDDPADDPPLLPDWRVGSFLTTPKFAAPRFLGMHLDYDAAGDAHYGFNYELTSVLQRAATTPKPFPQPQNGSNTFTHVVAVFLTTDNGSQRICGIGRAQPSSAATIPIGNFRLYLSPDDQCATESSIVHCVLPGRGVYELHYLLDSVELWDEGSDGEGNNIGTMGTVYLHD